MDKKHIDKITNEVKEIIINTDAANLNEIAKDCFLNRAADWGLPPDTNVRDKMQKHIATMLKSHQ